MSGTKAGASKAVATMLKKHGKDYYARIGAKGGKACVPKGFASNRERARLAGIKGCEATEREVRNKGGKMKNKTTLKGSLLSLVSSLVALIATIAIIGAIIWVVWAVFHFSWQASEEVVSGIVYDAHFDDWPAHNTTFKIRAAAEMAVTEETSPTYCLPSGSQYESVVREAAENKDIKVIVKVKQMPPHFREGVFKCEDNVEVAKKEQK